MSLNFLKPLLIVLLLFCKSIYAQSYIEVTVQDTVMLKADYFLYTFTVTNLSYVDVTTDTGSYNETDKNETGLQRLEKDFASIALDLKKNNFKFSSPSMVDSLSILSPANGFIKTGTLVIFNRDSLILANQILKRNPKVVAYVQAKKTITAADEKRLYKKLLDAAYRQAENIASLAGRKIKEIESVTKKDDVSNEGRTVYPPLSALETSIVPGWHTSIGTTTFASGSTEIYFPAGNTFVVKFSLHIK